MMERLTCADEKKGNRTIRQLIDVKAVQEHAMKFYWKLKKYEDTGMEPEEVQGATQLNALLADCGISIDRLRELAAADREGRVVVLPYRLNDTVYIVHRYKFAPSGITSMLYGDLLVRIRMLPYGDCAKVYSTREAAEAAMKEGESGKENS